jgi:hypothetical protein
MAGKEARETDQPRVLTARQLLRGAMRRLGRRRRIRNVWMQSGARSLIADDSDHHRIRRGYMLYLTAKIIQVGPRADQNYWLLARGEGNLAYPAAAYDSDLLARRIEPPFEFGKPLAERVAAIIGEASFFRHSLTVALSDGNMFCPTVNQAGARLGILLEGKAGQWLAQRAEYNNELLLAATLQPVVNRSYGYRPEAANELANLVVRALEAC